MALVRGWLAGGHTRLGFCSVTEKNIDHTAVLASALLLGESAALSSEEMGKILAYWSDHVLAISGQHLVFWLAFCG